jgi:hypothetical protein
MSASSENGVWVTERELIVRGIGGAAQKRGRESGKLRFTPLGGDSFAYREQDISAWLANENGNQRGSAFVRSPATVASPATRQTTSAGGAKAAWNAAVQAETATAGSMRAAIAAADRKHPGLRLRMLAEVNG